MDPQSRQFGSAIQWNFVPLDAFPEICGTQFDVAGDPFRALGEEQSQWANQAGEATLEPSEGEGSHREAVPEPETVQYTFPWATPEEGCAGPSRDAPVAGPTESFSDSLLAIPDASVYGNYFQYHDDLNEPLYNPMNGYALPEGWPSGSQISQTPAAIQPDPCAGANTSYVPSSHVEMSGMAVPHGTTANKMLGSLYGDPAWDAAAGNYEAFGPLQWSSEVFSSFPSHHGHSTPEPTLPPAFLQGSSTAHQEPLSLEWNPLEESAFSTERVLPPPTHPPSFTSATASGTPQCLSILPQVRDISNQEKKCNAEENPVSHTSLDTPTLRWKHCGGPQSSVEEQQDGPDEVLPIIQKSSKQTASLPCDFCTKLFSDTNSRRKHELLHSRTKTNQPSCPGCKKKLSRSDAVVRHVRRLYEKDPTNECVVVALRRGWRYNVRGAGKYLFPGKGLA